MPGPVHARWLRFISAVALALSLPLASGYAQGTAIVEGRVTDAATARALENVQISIDGTQLGAMTNAQGGYRIAGIPMSGASGTVVVRVRAIGYSRETRTVTLTPGQTSKADFAVTVSAIQLNQVVVTGSGQKTEVKRLGNTVSVITPPANAPINDMSNLLTAREPGVTGLVSGGLSGEGAKIRIRGNASLSQSNEPIIFVDGVRMNSGGGYGIGNGGGGSPSRIDDIDPSTIERVEVLKGAAAATLYGTEASNGVIQFFTKQGTSGPPRWNMQLQQDAVDFGDRVAPNSGFARTQVRADSLATYWNIPGLKAFQVFEVPIFNDYFTETGLGNTFSTSVAGGGGSITYFASGRYYNEDGPFGGADLGPARDQVRRIQTSANLSLVPFKNMRIKFNNNYYNTNNKSPENNNNIYGVNSLSYMARPELANCNASTYLSPGRCSGAGNPFGNQAFATAREAMQVTNETGAQRYVGILDAAYSQTSRLTYSGTVGFDYTAQRDFGLSPFGYNVDLFTSNNPDGARQTFSSGTRVLTLSGNIAYNRDFGSNWTTSTVGGLQVFNNRVNTQTGSSTAFPGPGIEVVGAGGLNISTGEGFSTTVNGGYFGQTQIGWRDWIFGTAGGRYDFSSAFGKSAGGVFYPKLSLSVVPSDRQSWTSTKLPTLRLRGAIGQSGRQPGAFDQFTTFSPLVTSLGSGLLPSQLGNSDLRPEISTEIEGGFEAGFLDNRLALEFTYWDRTVKDALVPRLFAQSGGFRQSQLTNIGQIDANGLEVGLRGSPIQRGTTTLELFANAAFLKQTLTSLGGAPPIRVSGGYARYRIYLKEGDPLGSIYEPRLASACGSAPATNKLGNPIACYTGDQLPFNFLGRGTPPTRAELLAYFAQPRDIQNSGVQNALQPLLADYDGSGVLFEQRVGSSIPKWTGAFGGTFNFRKHWKIQSTIEYRTGYKVSNLTDGFRLSQHPSIGSNRKEFSEVQSIMQNPASTPEQRVVASEEYIRKYRRLLEPGLYQAQDGSFARWRELALTYNLGETVASKLGFRNAALTVAGRNIFLWTRYPGQDPESNENGRGSTGTLADNFQNATDGFGLPIPRRISLTLNLGF